MAAGVLLMLLALAVVLVGVAGYLFSSCCGSNEPADAAPLVVAAALAASTSGAGASQLAAASRLQVLALASVLPLACGAYLVTGSPDFLAPALLCGAGWAVLWWMTARPAWRDWAAAH